MCTERKIHQTWWILLSKLINDNRPYTLLVLRLFDAIDFECGKTLTMPANGMHALFGFVAN